MPAPSTALFRITFTALAALFSCHAAQVYGWQTTAAGPMSTLGFNGMPQVGQVSYAQEAPVVEAPNLNSVDMWYQLAELNSLAHKQQQELNLLRQNVNAINGSDNSYTFFGNIEHVLVQPMQANNTGLIVETANGFSHVGMPWTMGYSPRIQFGLNAKGNLLGWRARFWHYNHTVSFAANAANGLIPVGRQGTVGYLSEDGDITTGLAFIESGTFFSKVRTDVIDVELQRELSERLNFYAGIRYGKIFQSYHADTDQGTADSYAEFRGFGPTVALNINHRFPYPNFSLFANLRQSLLFGHRDFLVKDSVNNITQSIGSIDVRSFEDGADALSSVSEIQLGARLDPLKWLAFTVAIEGQLYTNVGGANPSAVFIGRDNGLAGDSPMDDSIAFIGMNAGTEIYW